MHFDFNEDQTTFAGVLSQMLASDAAAFRTVEDWGRHDYGHALDAQLADAGFYDAASEETLGPVAAAALVYEAAQVPVALECAASALLRPAVPGDLPRPLAVMTDRPGPVRFLPLARSLVWLSESDVRVAEVPDGAAAPVASLFAYPMGQIDPGALDWRTLNGDPARLRDRWRVALAAELTGVLKGGMESVLAYVREREQFGQPLGSFQAIQHRMADGAVRIEGARWLTLRAAQSGDGADAALALGQAQAIATRITYDLHQFMGAMGLTLEHPLHRWTYRARLLRTEMGGSAAALGDYAGQRWGTE